MEARRNSFEMERDAGSDFSREQRAAAMSKAFSTGNLTSTLSGLQQLQPEPESSDGATCYYHKKADEHRIRIEFEGDGPLGIVFGEGAEGEIIVEDIQHGTASAEFPELATGLLLREIDGSARAARSGFPVAMRAIVSSWQADSAVALVFARPHVCAPAPPPRTTSGPPSLAGMVRIKDDGVGNLEHMSPIHEAHRKGATPRTGPSAQPRAPPPPPELSLAGLEPAAAPAQRRVETKRERQLREVRQFLCDLKVEGFLDAFVEFGVSSMEDLLFIEAADLPGFGLKPLQQRRVATALVRLQNPSDADAAAGALASDRDESVMSRSPSQVFEVDALDPPALSLQGTDSNVFISPFLPPAAVQEEAARLRQKSRPGAARLHTLQVESADV